MLESVRGAAYVRGVAYKTASYSAAFASSAVSARFFSDANSLKPQPRRFYGSTSGSMRLPTPSKCPFEMIAISGTGNVALQRMEELTEGVSKNAGKKSFYVPVSIPDQIMPVLAGLKCIEFYDPNLPENIKLLTSDPSHISHTTNALLVNILIEAFLDKNGPLSLWHQINGQSYIEQLSACTGINDVMNIFDIFKDILRDDRITITYKQTLEYIQKNTAIVYYGEKYDNRPSMQDGRLSEIFKADVPLLTEIDGFDQSSLDKLNLRRSIHAVVNLDLSPEKLFVFNQMDHYALTAFQSNYAESDAMELLKLEPDCATLPLIEVRGG